VWLRRGHDLGIHDGKGPGAKGVRPNAQLRGKPLGVDACRHFELVYAVSLSVTLWGKWLQLKASSIGIEAFAPPNVHRRSKLTWYSYLDRLFTAFGIGCLVGAGLVLLVQGLA
jgi:hypothetical protein